jgi:hypothetical protein
VGLVPNLCPPYFHFFPLTYPFFPHYGTAESETRGFSAEGTRVPGLCQDGYRVTPRSAQWRFQTAELLGCEGPDCCPAWAGRVKRPDAWWVKPGNGFAVHCKPTLAVLARLDGPAGGGRAL